MKIRISKFREGDQTVSVTFTHSGVTHRRSVNACLTDDGTYDAATTANRVAEVAKGVEHKIAVGAIA